MNINNKDIRLELIKGILRTHKVSNQHKLQQMLAEKGIRITQATLSRDLNILKVGKIADPTLGHIYALPEQLHPENEALPERDFPLESIQSLNFSGNLGVLKCLPSFAPSIALLLDELRLPEIVGTVAGDDTVLIVLNEDISPEQFMRATRARLPGLRKRF